MLSDAELKRYSRQIPLFGEEGQERLKRAHVILAAPGPSALPWPITWLLQALAGFALSTATGWT